MDSTINVDAGEREAALRYAKQIANTLWAKHWKEESPDFKPFDELIGVLSQIDNMLSDLERRKNERTRQNRDVPLAAASVVN